MRPGTVTDETAVIEGLIYGVSYFVTSLDSMCRVVSIGTRLQAGWSRVHNLVWADFSSPKCSDQLWGHLASYSNGSRVQLWE
jgi:hypothetical protein